jgi:hypothetical protein
VQESSVRYGTAGVVSNSGVVFLTDVNSEVRFRTASSHEFFRAVRYAPGNSECFNNLKKIRFAKELWAYSSLASWPNEWALDQAPYDAYLFGSTLYLPTKPYCPLGGPIMLGAYASQPVCPVHSPLVEPSW